MFRASPVVYRDHRRGPGGPPSGATSPGGLHGPSVGGDQPQVGWCAPHQGPRRRGLKTLGEGGASTLLGGQVSPSWPPPLPSRWDLEGAGVTSLALLCTWTRLVVASCLIYLKVEMGIAQTVAPDQIMCWAAPKPQVYIGGEEGLRPHLGFPP